MTDAVDRLAAALSDRYRIERELGQGGMAMVYLAQDLKHDRTVALKALRADVAQAVGTERFLQEIRLAARLSHPHILPLFDSGEAAGFRVPVLRDAERRWRARADSASHAVPGAVIQCEGRSAHSAIHLRRVDRTLGPRVRGCCTARGAGRGHWQPRGGGVTPAGAVRRRDPSVFCFAHGWPGLEPLQTLPEYQAILRDIGLTQWGELEKGRGGAAMSDRLATALADRYRIERDLGAGGVATVYLAQDLKHDRQVAIEVLRPELAAGRFVQEITTTAKRMQ